MSYFTKRHSLALPCQKGGSTPRTLIPVWTLPLRVAGPLTNKVEKGWKKCTDPMMGGAKSITLYDACTPSSGVVPGLSKWCSRPATLLLVGELRVDLPAVLILYSTDFFDFVCSVLIS